MSMNSVSSNNTMAPLVVKKHLGDCRGRRFNPWSGKFHPPCGVAKEKEKKKGKKKIKFANLKKNTNVVSLSLQLQVVAYIPCV